MTLKTQPKNLPATKADLAALEKKMWAKLTSHDSRFKSQESRLESVESRLESVESRLESVESRMQAMETHLINELTKIKDEIMGELKTIREEQEILSSQHHRLLDLEEEVDKLKKIHPHYSHNHPSL